MFYNWFQGTRSPQSQQVLPKNPDVKLLRNLARNSLLRIPIEHIEDTISRLPIEISNVDPSDTKDYSEQKKVIQRVLKNPNAVQSWVPYIKMKLEDLLVYGAAASQKAIGGDPKKPLWLYPTDASTLQFVVPYDYQNTDAARYMQLQPQGQRFFSAKEVAYIQKNYFSDRPEGLSPVRAAYDYIRILLESHERAGDIASNATADFLISLGEGINDEQRQKFIKYMQEEIQGTGTIPVVAGAKSVETRQIRSLSKDGIPLEFIELLTIIIGLAFKYPPERMGVLRSGDRSTQQEIDNQILENCVKPYANVIVDFINEHIVETLGYGDILKVSFVYAETEEQKTSKSNRLTKELISGGITENEFRTMMGYKKSESKYADMTIKEATAKMNQDMPSNTGGFNGQGSAKDGYSDKVTDNKLGDRGGET
jgi:hypothetical protein